MKHQGSAQFGIPIRFLWTILGLFSVLIISLFEYQQGTTPSNILKLSILSLVLITIIIFYILSQHMELDNIIYFSYVLMISYIVSILLIMCTRQYTGLHLWLFGGLAVAMILDLHLGYIVTYNLVFFASLVGDKSIETIIYLLIIGTLLCLLSKYMKNITTIGYSLIILLSIQIILLLLINNFMIQDTVSINALYSILSSIAVVAASLGSYVLYTKLQKIRQKKFEMNELIENSQIRNKVVQTIIDQELSEDILKLDAAFGSVLKDVPAGTHSLEEIISPDFPLIERMRKYSKKMYKHSLLISELSGRAAKVVEANELLAKAGGLYHEIGRMEGKQYVEEGIKLVKAYHLPEAIADIIAQHNLKYEKPKTPEAAVVMMCVSIVSTIEYLENNKNNMNGKSETADLIPNQKIIDSVFQMRLAKGSLDESGLTIQQFNQLKDFYLHFTYADKELQKEQRKEQ